ncbi:MAG TPA: putative toxin-antitoxin system toxin component, PIN family [Chloroflexota bacterium]|nr:putative toxin-antitoxin system toxin component, PIN family [Chloroflexota bacterium]HUM71816.1 putative toxin-antitoxin system toxin component, PIN family [Chloroflexota bacterium]
MSELAFVFDTNVVISALLLKNSVSRLAFDKAIVDGRLLISLETIDELNDVLKRPKFNKYVTEKERRQFVATLVQDAELVTITQQIAICRDPKDDKFLELAISGEADCIVSGDKDLLSLHPFQGISIVRPDAFLNLTWQ